MMPERAISLKCSLCDSSETEFYHKDKWREYFRCTNCELVWVPSEFFLSREAEKKHYDFHQNSPADPQYRKFLSRVFLPLQERLASASFGLDFGSGPGPTLSVMFEEAGHTMAIYDPIYAHDEKVWERDYDFITATEVVEHLRNPGQELEKLWSCLRPGGWLGIMTQWVINQERFQTWHYKEDLTHICFYSESIFRLLAARWNATLTVIQKDIVLLQKPKRCQAP